MDLGCGIMPLSLPSGSTLQWGMRQGLLHIAPLVIFNLQADAIRCE